MNILIVDDDSPDGTGEIAKELAAQRPGALAVIHGVGKHGLGAAYSRGFEWVLRHGAQIVIQMDCDFSHSPEYIPQMLYEIRDDDVVVGSRFARGGEIDERWDTARYLLSWWANAVYTRFILNLQVKDATSGFKCWRAEVLQNINLEEVSPYGYSFQIEMAYITQKLGYRVKEIPIYFEDRRIGRSRLTLPIKLEAAIRTWRILWRYRNLTRDQRMSQFASPAAETDAEETVTP